MAEVHRRVRTFWDLGRSNWIIWQNPRNFISSTPGGLYKCIKSKLDQSTRQPQDDLYFVAGDFQHTDPSWIQWLFNLSRIFFIIENYFFSAEIRGKEVEKVKKVSVTVDGCLVVKTKTIKTEFGRYFCVCLLLSERKDRSYPSYNFSSILFFNTRLR